jgi:hypothetical protein
MKTKQLFILILLSGLMVLGACKKDESDTNLGYSYFPLSVGNNWQVEQTYLREIQGKTLIEGKEYYIMVINGDSSYYRNDGNIVWSRSLDSEEFPLFKFNIPAGTTWSSTLIPGGSNWNITLLSKTDSITINGRLITNCYRYFFNIPSAVDDEHTVTLAPGIGYIEEDCGFCPNPKRQLQHATIDGVQITF